MLRHLPGCPKDASGWDWQEPKPEPERIAKWAIVNKHGFVYWWGDTLPEETRPGIGCRVVRLVEIRDGDPCPGEARRVRDRLISRADACETITPDETELLVKALRPFR